MNNFIDKDGVVCCGFCGKKQHEVIKLIAGPICCICNECLKLCLDMIKKEVKDE